jgi:hypothetical protein
MKTVQKMSLLFVFIFPILCLAQQSSTITGKLLGSDGNPMIMSHVRLAGGTGFTERLVELDDPEFFSAQTGSDGTFEIATDSLGALSLIFTGVGHQWLRVPLILMRPTTLSIRVHLSPLPLKDDLSDATLLYDFDDVARGKSMAFTKKASGYYEVDLPSAKKEFKYRIFLIR